jgi:tRNA nucleotidyltransferase/poly(A) polymerase
MIEDGMELARQISDLTVSGEAYLVGGCVRDLEMDRELHDVDIATNVPMEIIERSFLVHEIGTSKDFGILAVKFRDAYYEVAQFRTEEKYTDGRHPDHVKFVTSIDDDLARRDFTMNAMAMDPNTAEIIDPHGGLIDIEDKIIRTVGDPLDRFQEDGLRIIRMARFAAVLDFGIDKLARQAAIYNVNLVNNLAIERFNDEMYKAATAGGKELWEFFLLLTLWGVMKQICPLIDEYMLTDLPHSPWDHPEGNVRDHVCCACEASESNDPVTNLAVFFHDIGKLRTHEEVEDPRGMKHTYYDHDSVGEKLFCKIVEQLKIANADANAIKYCIRNHMRFFAIPEMRRSKLSRMVREEHFEMLKNVAKADCMVRDDDSVEPEHWTKIIECIEEIIESLPSDEELILRKRLNGRIIMEILDLKSGKRIGEIKETLYDWAIEEKNGTVTDEEICEKILSMKENDFRGE